MTTETKTRMDELFEAVSDRLLGADGQDKLAPFFKEQIEAVFNDRGIGDNMMETIAELRDAMSSKPPPTDRPQTALEFLGSGDNADRLTAMQVLGLMDSSGYNPAAPGTVIDGAFDGTLDYLRSVLMARNGYTQDGRLRLITEHGNFKEPGPPPGPGAALTGQELELGGALVPEEFRAAMYGYMLGPTAIRQRAQVIPMSTASMVMPVVRDADHLNTSPYGIIPDWIEVGDQIRESEPTFGRIQIIPKAVAFRTVLENTFLQDSAIGAIQFVFGKYPEAVRWEEEKQFLGGTGAGLPLGIKNAPGTVDAGTPATTFTLEESLDMITRLYDPMGRAVWMMSNQFLPELYKMNMGANTNEAAFQRDLTRPIPDMLHGYPIIWSELTGAPASDGDIVLADWSQYIIGDRMALSMAASEHSQFDRYRTEIRGVARLDGQPWVIEPQTGADNLTRSPFVTRKS